MHVVDRDDDRALGGEGLEDAQKPYGGRSGVRLTILLGIEQRGVEGTALRQGKFICQLGVRRRDEIRERRIGERRFRLRGPGNEDAKAAPSGTVERLAPDRRLADSGLAVHDQRAAGRGDPVEKPLDRSDVLIPANDHGWP